MSDKQARIDELSKERRLLKEHLFIFHYGQLSPAEYARYKPAAARFDEVSRELKSLLTTTGT